MGAISQLQMSYSPEEDRVLLRVNTTDKEEFRFWLTRRYCQLLLQSLEKHRSSDPDVSVQPTPAARQAIQEFKQEAANSQGNFQEAFRDEESEKFPIGEEPVLAHVLKYNIDNGKLALTIEPKGGKGIRVVLDSKFNFNVTRLLQTVSAKGGWQLAFGNTELPAAATANRVIN